MVYYFKAFKEGFMSKTADRGTRFDYFYGRAAENYQFFRIPKVLVTDKRYRKVSRDAKLLYGLLLDRASLSYANGWVDDQGRVYIIYSIKEIMEDLCCSNKTAVGFLAELDTERGIGLIEKVRRGQGEKSWIYVKDFTTDAVVPDEEGEIEAADEDETKTIEKDKRDDKNTLESLENIEKCKNYTSRSVEPEFPEVKKLHFKKCKNYTSRNVETTLPEVKKLHSNNNTNINKTDRVILSQSSSSACAEEEDDDLTKNLKETEYMIIQQTGLASMSDADDGTMYYSEGTVSLLTDVIGHIIKEDTLLERKDRIDLLLHADKRDVDTVCKKLSRYGGSVQDPIKYTEKVLINTLAERYLQSSRQTPPSQQMPMSDAVGSETLPVTRKSSGYRTTPSYERKYTKQEWDDLETKLLRASGYNV